MYIKIQSNKIIEIQDTVISQVRYMKNKKNTSKYFLVNFCRMLQKLN